VGVKVGVDLGLLRRAIFALGAQACLLGAFDLRDPSVVDHELNHPIAQVADLLTDEFKPLGFRRCLRRMER
jgi:hypothetical protein